MNQEEKDNLILTIWLVSLYVSFVLGFLVNNWVGSLAAISMCFMILPVYAVGRHITESYCREN